MFCISLSAAAYSNIQACFTPGENCTAEILRQINTASNTVLVQAYSFASTPIAKALVDAMNNGVNVKVILDKSQKSQRYSSATFLLNHNIPTWIDYKPAIAHIKVMIIVGKEVITGSFNFTKAAQEKNAENLLIIRDAELAMRYAKNWSRRKVESKKDKQLQLVKSRAFLIIS